MSNRHGGFAAVSTLVLATLLHAFTHALATLLVPLYLLMRTDLNLPGVKWPAMIVTVYGTVYALLSFPAGVMADRVSRKRMLGWGLIFNALAVGLMGLTKNYEALLLLAVAAGICGTIFHPAANALIPEHFPKSPGMAIGMLGIGSGLGFYAGPRFAGWRAESAHWNWHGIAAWQRPCVEAGAVGILFGILFLFLAREVRPDRAESERTIHPPLGKTLRWRITAIALVLGSRDFAGVASISLASIYLQKALGADLRETGLIVGTMMLTGVIANPLAVWLSPGRKRLPGLTCVLIAAGISVSLVPLFPTRGRALAMLCIYQSFQLGSYAMSDAGMLERVPANTRGRVVGLFLSIAGTFAGLSPWAMGFWTDKMHEAATRRLPYLVPFGTLGAMMIFSALSTPIIARLGKPDERAINPLSEIMPRTMEAV